VDILCEDIQFGIAVEVVVVNFAVEDLEAIEFERDEAADHLGPAFVDMCLRSGFGRAFGEVDDGMLHFDLGLDGAVEQSAPLYGKVDGLGGEEGDGNLAVRFVEPHIFYSVCAADQGYVDIFDMTGVSFYPGKLAVDVTQEDVG